MSELHTTAPRYRILIVDDDDDVRDALVDELELSYDVTAVATGREALGELDSGTYDAIISDQRMPGMSGVQVLTAARERDDDLVRILLTGFVDEDAHRATMEDNAPYKIGKPWHDEVEVTLKRAFENRRREHALSGSVTDALALAGIDAELAAVDGIINLSHLLVRRCTAIEGVQLCKVHYTDEDGERVLAERGERVTAGKGAWSVDVPINVDGALRLLAEGSGATARDIVDYIAARALHWSSEDSATRLAKRANADAAVRERLGTISRRATLGTMTVALVHELASMVQSLQGALFELDDFVRVVAEDSDDPELLETLSSAVETSARMVALFRAMRTFVRSGDSAHRPCSLESLVERSVALCRGELRSMVKLEVSDVPDEEVDVNEALFLQVLVNLLRNAAEASPYNGTVHFAVRCEKNHAIFSVRDHGQGVAEDLLNELFEPFTTTKDDDAAAGLGLAISSEIVAEHGGRLTYELAEGGGACFSVSLPLVPRPAPQLV